MPRRFLINLMASVVAIISIAVFSPHQAHAAFGVTAPTAYQTVSSFHAIVDWTGGVTCSYAYDQQGSDSSGTGWNTVNCGSAGSDILAPTSGSHTLIVRIWTGAGYTGGFNTALRTFRYTGATTTISSCAILEEIGDGVHYDYPYDGQYKLTADLDCSGTGISNTGDPKYDSTLYNGGEGFIPISNFSGTFDGQNHVISGLTIFRPSTDDVGLFGSAINSAIIKNVKLLGGSMNGSTQVGAVAGALADNAQISNVESTISITGTSTIGGIIGGSTDNTSVSNASTTAAITSTAFQGTYIGGIGGYVRGSTSNVTARGTISAGAQAGDIGGIVGYNETNASITNATSSVDITAGEESYDVGGIAGMNYHTITNAHFDGSIGNWDDAYGVGGIVGENATDYSSISNSFYNIENVVMLGGRYVTPYGLYNTQYAIWKSGNYAPLNFADFFPTTDADGYYDLATASDLKKLLPFLSTDMGGLKFKVTAPITVPQEFYIPYMNAEEFDGGDYPITNLTLNRNEWGLGIGFFGIIGGNMTVHNVVISNANIHAYSAGVLAYGSSGIIATSSTSGELYSTNVGGGLIGAALPGAVISGAQSSVNVHGVKTVWDEFPANMGGLIGYMQDATVGLSYATGSVDGTSRIGGFAGSNITSLIDRSYSTGSVSATMGATEYLGGFVGNNDGTTTDSYSTGNVYLADGYHGTPHFVGGFAGNNEVGIVHSYSTGSVVGDTDVGGFIGRNNANAWSSFSVGSVTGTTWTGGFVGLAAAGSALNDAGWWTGAGPTYAVGNPTATTVDRNESSKSAFYSATNPLYTASNSYYSTWDFTNVWQESATAYPKLRSLAGQEDETVTGCTDHAATNYNASANSDDGSCTYASRTQSPNTSVSSGGGMASPEEIARLLRSFRPATTSPIQRIATTTQPSFAFISDLSLGMSSPDIQKLQAYFNTHGYVIAAAGVGSPGHETDFFGVLTKAAVIKFQKAHALPSTGFFGPRTRAVVNSFK